VYNFVMSNGGLYPRGPDAGSPAAPQASRRSPGVILLVEDDLAIHDSLGESLEQSGYLVIAAVDGREALALLRSGVRPSAILLDLMMPVMDGWDFRQEQRRDPALRDIPVVVITASGFSASTVRTQFGEVEVIAKPIQRLELFRALARASAAAATGRPPPPTSLR
jgi:CheY-like chemotaxis protein